jgi:hypothetical protein
VHCPQRRPRQGDTEPLLQQPVQSREVETLDREPSEPRQFPLRRERQPRPLRVAQRQQDPDALVCETPRGREQHPRGGTVEPLDVVDCDEHGARGCERAQDAEEAERHAALIDAARVGSLEQECGAQRVPLRSG